MWNEYCAVLVLLWNSWTDIKRQEISVPCLGAAGAVGMAANLILKYQETMTLLEGVLLGIICLVLSAVTKGAVGFGDGLVLCVTGILLGGRENLQLITVGSVLCAFVLGLGLISGRVGWKQRFPFVPFLCAAQIGRILCR